MRPAIVTGILPVFSPQHGRKRAARLLQSFNHGQQPGVGQAYVHAIGRSPRAGIESPPGGSVVACASVAALGLPVQVTG